MRDHADGVLVAVRRIDGSYSVPRVLIVRGCHITDVSSRRGLHLARLLAPMVPYLYPIFYQHLHARRVG